MKIKIPVPKPIKLLSKTLNEPIYLVGGYVRDFILYGKAPKDVDFCAPIPVDKIKKVCASLSIKIVAEYKKTGTLKLRYKDEEFEYTAFRTEKYSSGGNHTPKQVEFTSDILLDAKRRDFKCNAIYYEVSSDKIVDCLGGLLDLENGVLSTAISPEEVFMHDGLRLLRFARFSAKHALTPKKEVVLAVKKYRNLIYDVSPERIKEELSKILSEREDLCLKGLALLIKTGVLKAIFGKNGTVIGEANFPVIVSKTSRVLRLFTLIYLYEIDADKITLALERLKVSRQEIKAFLPVINLLSSFFSGRKTDKEIRRLILDNFYSFSAFYEIAGSIALGKKRFSLRLEKWTDFRQKIIKKGTPITVFDLEISAKELIDLGVEPKRVKTVLNFLLSYCQDRPKDNLKTRLKTLALKFTKSYN